MERRVKASDSQSKRVDLGTPSFLAMERRLQPWPRNAIKEFSTSDFLLRQFAARLLQTAWVVALGGARSWRMRRMRSMRRMEADWLLVDGDG